MAFLKEFKEFALKGNVMDMAVGVIIGGAFGKIVTSLVNDILMPPIGMVLGNTSFGDLKIALGTPAEGAEQAYWNYGAFIQQCVDFLILAFCIFLIVKVMNRLMRKKEIAPAAPAPAPELTAEEKLLTEIRDLLKERK